MVAASENGEGIGVGGEAEIADGTVSLGRAETLRRLVHVARALEATQALIKRQMEIAPLTGQRDRTDQIAARLDQLENRILNLEYQLGIKQPPGGGGGGSPGWLLALLALPLFLRRR